MISKKLRKKLKKKSFEVDIFETTVFIIDSKKLFQKIYDNIDFDATTDNVNGLCLSTNKDGIKDIFIGIFESRDDILVHECVHASLYMLGNVNEKIKEDSELQPFLVQTLFRNCKRLLK